MFNGWFFLLFNLNNETNVNKNFQIDFSHMKFLTGQYMIFMMLHAYKIEFKILWMSIFISASVLEYYFIKIVTLVIKPINVCIFDENSIWC